jgi:hypothetical protein
MLKNRTSRGEFRYLYTAFLSWLNPLSLHQDRPDRNGCNGLRRIFLAMARITLVSLVCLLFPWVAKSQVTLVSSHEQEIRNSHLVHFTSAVDFRMWEYADDTLDEWREWEMADNYHFGINRGSLSMIKDLESLHPYFRDKVIEMIHLCRAKGIELVVVETYRTHAKQTEYKRMGRRYTRTKAGQSKHQYGLAVDLVPVIDSIPQWKNYRLWKKIGPIGERLGFRWGGRWRRLYDPCHFEWTGGLLTADLAKGKWPTVPKPQNYPCLQEDLKELRRHWRSWETEQAAIAVANRQKSISAASARTVLRAGEE